MDTLSSWLLILTIFFGIGFIMTILYARSQGRYIDELKKWKKEDNILINRLQRQIIDNAPPF